MKTLLLTLFTIISINSFSQNNFSYFSWRVTEGVYEYFDSLGLERLEIADTCDCGFILESKFSYFVSKENANDTLLLNEYADEDLIDALIKDYVKKFKKYGKPPFNEIYISADIKQVKNTFSIFRMSRKVRYKIDLNVNYKPSKQ